MENNTKYNLIFLKNWCFIFLYYVPKTYARDIKNIIKAHIIMAFYPSKKNIFEAHTSTIIYKYNRLFEKKMLGNGK